MSFDDGRAWHRLRGSLPRVPIHDLVIADGDLVATHSFVDFEPDNPENPGGAFMDFFRLEDGKIVEHWDVIQPVPETSANTNTMF